MAYAGFLSPFRLHSYTEINNLRHLGVGVGVGGWFEEFLARNEELSRRRMNGYSKLRAGAMRKMNVEF